MHQLDAAPRVGRAIAEHAASARRWRCATAGARNQCPCAWRDGPANSATSAFAGIQPRGQQLRQIRGIVLPVAIERADPLRARVAHARGDRGALPAAKRMAQQPDLRDADARAAMTAAAVASVLPSSTNSISNARPASAVATSCASGPTFSASLHTGIDDGDLGRHARLPSQRSRAPRRNRRFNSASISPCSFSIAAASVTRGT